MQMLALNVKQTAYLKVDGDFPVDGGRTAANTGSGCILLRADGGGVQRC